MDINKQLMYIGYMDMCTSLGQIEVAILTTTLSVYYLLHKNEIGFISVYLWLVVKVVITTITVLINVREIQCATHFIRVEQPIDFVEVEILKEVWNCWNKVTLFAAFLWFPCVGISTFLQHSWPLSVILTFFFGTIVSRGMVTWGIHAITLEREIYIPAFPQNLIEEFVGMRLPYRQQQMPLRGPGRV